ncbi:MAG: outer membrane beta-barrel protein, partial [Allomuricauda sp.]
MRKSTGLVVAIVLTTTLCIHAQEKNFGIVGGLNVSNIRGDIAELTNNDWRLAYHIGIFSNLPLSDKIAFEPRVEFSSIGYVDEVDFGLFGDIAPSPTVF